MRTLTLSLLTMILIATLGLGWLFDSFYQQYQQGSQETQSSQTKDELSVLETLGQSIAQALDGLENKQQFIDGWSVRDERRLDLLTLADFPLPLPLMND